MKRTTIYLDSDLEILLKLEAMKSGRPAVEVIREALSHVLYSAVRLNFPPAPAHLIADTATRPNAPKRFLLKPDLVKISGGCPTGRSFQRRSSQKLII